MDNSRSNLKWENFLMDVSELTEQCLDDNTNIPSLRETLSKSFPHFTNEDLDMLLTMETAVKAEKKLTDFEARSFILGFWRTLSMGASNHYLKEEIVARMKERLNVVTPQIVAADTLSDMSISVDNLGHTGRQQNSLLNSTDGSIVYSVETDNFVENIIPWKFEHVELPISPLLQRHNQMQRKPIVVDLTVAQPTKIPLDAASSDLQADPRC